MFFSSENSDDIVKFAMSKNRGKHPEIEVAKHPEIEVENGNETNCPMNRAMNCFLLDK